jgi:hypothetical protein
MRRTSAREKYFNYTERKKFKKLDDYVKKNFLGIYLNLGISKVSEIFILILNYFIIYLENPQNIFSQCNSQKSLRKKMQKVSKKLLETI